MKQSLDNNTQCSFLFWFVVLSVCGTLAAFSAFYYFDNKLATLTISGYDSGFASLTDETYNVKTAGRSTAETTQQTLAVTTAPGPSKYMLMWTPWMRDRDAKEIFEVNNNSAIWTTKNGEKCTLITSKSEVEQASAVIFHGCDYYPMGLDKTLPSIRYPWQRWIFFQIEAASNPSCTTAELIKQHPVLYNWTMTYQLKADVWYPYGMIRRREKTLSDTDRAAIQDRITQFAANFSNREFDAIWLVSNCGTSSGRENLYNLLERNGLKIERWGTCGSGRGAPDKEWQRIGLAQFFTRYRFYLGFENTLCDEYITEKAYAGYFHNVKHGLIPIVYGTGNYSYIFPNGSYINAYEIPPDKVAKLVREISTWDAKKLADSPYFNWQFTHEIDYLPRKQGDGFYVHYYNHKFGFQSLCERLWSADRNNEPSKTIKDLSAELGQCYPIPSFL